MNNERRKTLERIHDAISTAMADLISIKDEEQDAFDNMPEGLQQSEKGQRMEEVVSALEEAESNLEEALQNIEEAKS